MKDYLQSNTVTRIIVILGIVVIVLLAFQGGVLVGYHEGSFGSDRDSAYARGLGDPRSIFAPFMRDADDANPHGAVGEIVRTASSTFMLKGPSSDEQVVSFTPTTTIRLMRGAGTPSDIRVGEQAIVIGEPGQGGDIDAVFIRILPAPVPGSVPAMVPLPAPAP